MKKIINEDSLKTIIKKVLLENYFGNDFIYQEDKKEKEEKNNIESEKDSELRDSVESFFKQPGVNCAAYAYQLYGIKPKKGDDTDEMKNARSKFAKCLNHETNESGYPYNFTSSEITTLKGMISSNQISEAVRKSIRNVLKENYELDDELNYDLYNFKKAMQQSNGTYKKTSKDGSFSVGDMVIIKTKLGKIIQGKISDIDINDMTFKECADVDYWNDLKRAKCTIIGVPLDRMTKI